MSQENDPLQQAPSRVVLNEGKEIPPEAQGRGEYLVAPKVRKVPIPTIVFVIAAFIVLAVGGFLYWNLLPIAGTTEVREEPLVVGVIHFRQQHDAFVGLQEGLKELGYDDVIIFERLITVGPDTDAQMDKAARDFIAADVDVLWTSLELQARTVMRVQEELGDDTPHVHLTRFQDPVEYGLANSFRSSGNNSTGITVDVTANTERVIGFLKEIDPNIKRIGMFTHGFMVGDLSISTSTYELWQELAPKHGLEIVEYTTDVPPPQAETEFFRIADTIRKGDIDAIAHIPGHYYPTQEAGELELANRLGIPAYSQFEDLVLGGHFTFSDNFGAAGKRSAVLIDKIVNGTHPSDIPIEYGSDTVLLLHLGRARDAGIEFSDTMLFVANHKLETDEDFKKIPFYHNIE